MNGTRDHGSSLCGNDYMENDYMVSEGTEGKDATSEADKFSYLFSLYHFYVFENTFSVFL